MTGFVDEVKAVEVIYLDLFKFLWVFFAVCHNILCITFKTLIIWVDGELCV